MTDFSLICAWLAIGGGLASLVFLTLIDLKYRLLPNTYVLCFLLFGVAFHAALDFELHSPLSMVGGATMGGGFLWTIRAVFNYLYKKETLGLGDVKLLIAAGAWLAAPQILNAIVIGAMAGLIHGVILAKVTERKTGKDIKLRGFTLPAGPGFIIGILAVLIYTYWAHYDLLLP